MGYLRGMMAKSGQVLATYPNILPDQVVDLLSTLCFEAPPMHYALIREHLINELGDDPETMFDEFETKAFAAASLGQVHRARLKNGRPVAVKVQYPNIARTIQADYRNIMALMTPMRLSRDWDNIREQWEDVRCTVEKETDYRREAKNLQRAAGLFQADENIVVPRVYPELSTGKVLTMEHVEGPHLNEYLAGGPSQEDRNRFGKLLMLASFRLAHRGQMWYGDANQGNFVFMPDGRLGLLDFGCVREFTSEEWDLYRGMWRSAIGPKDDLYYDALRRSAAIDPDARPDPDYMQFLDDFADWWCAYLFVDGEFDFGDEAFIQKGIEFMKQVARNRWFRCMPVNIWISRQLLGLRGILYKLRARIAVRALAMIETDLETLGRET